MRKWLNSDSIEYLEAMDGRPSSPYLEYWQEEAKLLKYFSEQVGPVERVITLGCGVFREEAVVRQFSDGKIYALDFDEKILKMAKDLHKGKSVEFVSADVCNLPFRARSFGGIFILFNTLGNFAQPIKALEEVARVLRSDGFLYLSCWSDSEAVAKYREEVYLRVPGRSLRKRAEYELGDRWYICANSKVQAQTALIKSRDLKIQLCKVGLEIEETMCSFPVSLYKIRLRPH